MDKKPHDNKLGDSGAAVEGIRELATKPEVFNVLPFRHNYTPDGRYILSSMFIPCYRNAMFDDGVKYIDDRGWCNLEKAKERFEKERTKKASDPKALLIYKAEYCFTIEEALIQQGDNIFPREELAEQLANIDIYKTVPIPKTGNWIWKTDKDGRRIGVKWVQDDSGKLQILEHPLISESGLEYKNLYVGGIDSIDIGSDDSATKNNTTKVSDFCIVIKKRVFGQQQPMYVALYKDRPKDIREAYDIAAKLLTYYNCQAVLESTRTAILTYFRERKFLHLLMKRPRSTMPDISKGNSNMYGTPTPTKVISHYRELIYDFVLDYWNTIAFREMIEQLLNYSDEKKKEFDIIAALGMCELGDEELSVKKPTEKETEVTHQDDIGWWKDNKGYKHYGIIPKSEEEKNERTRIRREDSWLYNETL